MFSRQHHCLSNFHLKCEALQDILASHVYIAPQHPHLLKSYPQHFHNQTELPTNQPTKPKPTTNSNTTYTPKCATSPTPPQTAPSFLVTVSLVSLAAAAVVCLVFGSSTHRTRLGGAPTASASSTKSPHQPPSSYLTLHR